MILKRQLLWLIPVVVVTLLVFPRFGTTRTYEVPFDQMIDYLDDRLQAEFRGPSDDIGNLRGTPYLQSDTFYFTDRRSYRPGQLLKFKAWFAQIGDETLHFTVRALPDNKTSIRLKYRCLFGIIPSPSLERKNLKTIGQDIDQWLSESGKAKESPTTPSTRTQ